jgi:hypothetical protein
MDAFLPVDAEKISLADVHLARGGRIVRLVPETEALPPVLFQLPVGILQAGETAPLLPAQEEVDRTVPDRLVVVEMDLGEGPGRHVLQHDGFDEVRPVVGGFDLEPFLDKMVIGAEAVVQRDVQPVAGKFKGRPIAGGPDLDGFLRPNRPGIGRHLEADSGHGMENILLLVADGANRAILAIDLQGDARIFQDQRFGRGGGRRRGAEEADDQRTPGALAARRPRGSPSPATHAFGSSLRTHALNPRRPHDGGQLMARTA